MFVLDSVLTVGSKVATSCEIVARIAGFGAVWHSKCQCGTWTETAAMPTGQISELFAATAKLRLNKKGGQHPMGLDQIFKDLC
jgi:hypothetical protein